MTRKILKKMFFSFCQCLYLYVQSLFSLQMTALSKKVPAIQKLSSMPTLQPFVWVVKKTFITFSLSYALVSFGLLEWNKYFKVKFIIDTLL